jgi:thioredoxin
MMSKMEKLIDAETEKQLKEKFQAEMKGTVDVKVFTNPILAPGKEQTEEINEFAKQLVRELSQIDARIIVQNMTISDDTAKKLNIKTSPSISVGYDLGYRIIYNGAPLGYETTGLIETLILVSRGESGLSGSDKEAIRLIDRDTFVQVFVTPTCPYCPRSVLNANRMAIEARGKITAECVESSENSELASKFHVSSVPQQVINGSMESISIGAIPEEVFVRQVLQFGAPDKYGGFMEKEKAIKAEREKLPDKPQGTVIISDDNFSEAMKKYGNLVVDCWAEWCSPCKAIAPVIEELAAENAGAIVFGKLNVDENPKTSAERGIASIPTLFVFKNGELKGTVIGAQPKQQLGDRIKELLGL